MIAMDDAVGQVFEDGPAFRRRQTIELSAGVGRGLLGD
jgi:hypothetical protein